ncbi:MAG: 2,3-bisphosphoglycerate-independent phosphoglycerate mutase [Planctomycetota bacterium]|jgi:2,3-bisphosphoglycerate-independent phosphoglycerate mutase
MLNKAILIIFDGLGDRPIKEFGGLTPLEYAKTPNFDKIAQNAECGLMNALGRGLRPGSDTSHLAILGYDPEMYYSGRGPIEVAGIGLDLKDGDVALRGNMGTIDENMVIVDRRAGRILDVSPLTKELDGMEVDGVKFVIKPGTAHRAGVIMRGKNLSSAITDADPHELNVPLHTVEATDDTPEAKRTAEILNKFIKEAYGILKELDFNKERVKAGNLQANCLLVRGAGQYKDMPSFKERYGLSACCVAGGGLYKGIGAFLGMEIINVPGATALPDSDVEAKFKTALKKLDKHDFAFVHVKATDSLGEDGNFEAKKDFIEKADKAAAVLQELPEDILLVISADHSTPCELKNHSADPVPIIFKGGAVRIDEVATFGERACAKGALGFIEGKHIMPQILNLMGRLPLIGA